MFPLLASALLPVRRALTDERFTPVEDESPQPVAPLTLVPPVSLSTPLMSSNPSPLSNALVAMLDLLDDFVPPQAQPPQPPDLPPSNVVLASVIERTVGLGSRVGTDVRGPFMAAALKGIRVEAVARYEVWTGKPIDVALAIEELIKNLLGAREQLRTNGFLRVALKSVGTSENVFAEDAWRQNVEFDVLFEFPYLDTDDAESIIAQIPIKLKGEVDEFTLVVDQMARWDNETAPALQLRGPFKIGALSALAFIPAAEPGGTVVVTRTFDGASGAPNNHPTLTSFIAAVGGDNPTERHAAVSFASIKKFLSAITSFKITDEALAGMEVDGVAANVRNALTAIKDKEVGGEDEFIARVEATTGPLSLATRSIILKRSATSNAMTLGDWDQNNLPDQYQSHQLRVEPLIHLVRVPDRLEITYVDVNFDPVKFDKVAVVYLRATRGLTL